MGQRPGLPNPELLKMPLRDVARGLKGAAHLTQDALAPVLATLPSPLHDALSDALGAIQSQGKSVLPLSIDHSEIQAASQFIAGHPAGKASTAACAKVIAFAWDRLNLGDLASETVLAAHLGQVGAETVSPEAHAASVLLGMSESHAFGKMPGVPLPEGEADRQQVAAALIAPTVWLLAEREATLDDDLRLLDLSSALAGAFTDDIRAALGKDGALAPLLKSLACHL